MNEPVVSDDITMAERVRQLALRTAQSLEEGYADLDYLEGLDLDVLDVVADTSGRVVLVLTTGGPHVELHLGRGVPTVHVFWGGEEWACPLIRYPEELDDVAGAYWHAAMAACLADPPYEG